jgi:hypothetical protein
MRWFCGSAFRVLTPPQGAKFLSTILDTPEKPLAQVLCWLHTLS